MPVKTNIYNQNGDIVGELKLADEVFAVKINTDLIHQALVCQTSKQRQVLAHTKTRAEVRGGGRKPWKQKGTGRARAGSSRSPIWIGGGITFGPRSDRNFSQKINKKMKQKAINMVLSDRLASHNLVAIDKIELDGYSTKQFDNFVKKMEVIFSGDQKSKRSLLLLGERWNDQVFKSARNLTGLSINRLGNMNILELLKYRNILITEATLKLINERHQKTKLT